MSEDELSVYYHPVEEPLIEPSTKQHSNNESNDALSVISSTSRSLAGESLATIAAGATKILHNWKLLAFGQLIPILAVTEGAALSELDEKCVLNSPTLRCFFMYILLMTHFFIGDIKIFCCKQSIAHEDDDEGLNVSVGEHDLPETAEDNAIDLYENADNSSSQILPSGNSNENNSSRHKFSFTYLPMQSKWWLFLIAALIDVEANTLNVLAFRYTTITSVVLLSFITVPAAMVASRFLLKWKYGLTHVIGICICLSGALVNILSDVDDYDQDADNKLLGDFIAVGSAILFGFLDALIELVCKKFSSSQYLYSLGFFGTIITIVQISLLERDELVLFFGNNADCSMGWAYGLQTIYTISVFFFYTSIAYFLSISEATLLNLSMLTMNIYSVLFSIIFQENLPQPLFYIAAFITVIGIVVYESAPSPMRRMES